MIPAAILGACTNKSNDGALDPPPPEGGQQLATPSYDLDPGQEVYMCYSFYSPADASVAVTHVDTISMPGIHHMAIYQSFGVDEPDAPHVCGAVIKETWLPIFVTGTGSQSIDMPSGTGIILEPATQFVVQLHLVNATDSTVHIRGGVNLGYDHNPSALQPVGIYALGNQSFTIPAGATDYQAHVDCTPGYDQMNLFAVFPHMHLLGTSLEVTHAVSTETPTNMYTIDPWVFGSQPVTPMPMTLGKTDSLHLTCHYNNTTGADVTYGESTSDEMCYFIMFYYPFTTLDGCIE